MKKIMIKILCWFVKSQARDIKDPWRGYLDKSDEMSLPDLISYVAKKEGVPLSKGKARDHLYALARRLPEEYAGPVDKVLRAFFKPIDV